MDLPQIQPTHQLVNQAWERIFHAELCTPWWTDSQSHALPVLGHLIKRLALHGDPSRLQDVMNDIHSQTAQGPHLADLCAKALHRYIRTHPNPTATMVVPLLQQLLPLHDNLDRSFSRISSRIKSLHALFHAPKSAVVLEAMIELNEKNPDQMRPHNTYMMYAAVEEKSGRFYDQLQAAIARHPQLNTDAAYAQMDTMLSRHLRPSNTQNNNTRPPPVAEKWLANQPMANQSWILLDFMTSPSRGFVRWATKKFTPHHFTAVLDTLLLLMSDATQSGKHPAYAAVMWRDRLEKYHRGFSVGLKHLCHPRTLLTSSPEQWNNILSTMHTYRNHPALQSFPAIEGWQQWEAKLQAAVLHESIVSTTSPSTRLRKI